MSSCDTRAQLHDSCSLLRCMLQIILSLAGKCEIIDGIHEVGFLCDRSTEASDRLPILPLLSLNNAKVVPCCRIRRVEFHCAPQVLYCGCCVTIAEGRKSVLMLQRRLRRTRFLSRRCSKSE